MHNVWCYLCRVYAYFHTQKDTFFPIGNACDFDNKSDNCHTYFAIDEVQLMTLTLTTLATAN